MSTFQPSADNSSGTTPENWQSKTHHTKEDALSDREWEFLLEGAQSMRDPYSFDAQLVVIVGGRLGMRAGEIVHMTESWIDWQEKIIQIPHHDRCTKGRDGGICGYCESLAQQRVDHHDGALSIEEARAQRWHPKTRNSAREVPFGFSTRAEIVLERYFERFDEFTVSRQGVNRRVEKAAEKAPGLSGDDVYPHALRASAASHHAGRGLEAFQLQQLLGWEDVRTALKYVQRSGERTARALERIHNG